MSYPSTGPTVPSTRPLVLAPHHPPPPVYGPPTRYEPPSYPPPPTPDPPRPERPRPALARRSPIAMLMAALTAVGGAVAVYAVYVVAVLDRTGRELDDGAMRAAEAVGRSFRTELLSVLNLVTVPAVVLALVVLVGVAVLRRRVDLAVSVTTLVLGAQGLTELLKTTLTRPGGDNSLPSGHVTLVASLVVALLMVLPPLLRVPVVLLGVPAVALAGLATMLVGWHRPSDVVAAVAVVVGWAGAVTLARLSLAPRRPRSGRESVT